MNFKQLKDKCVLNIHIYVFISYCKHTILYAKNVINRKDNQYARRNLKKHY